MSLCLLTQGIIELKDKKKATATVFYANFVPVGL